MMNKKRMFLPLFIFLGSIASLSFAKQKKVYIHYKTGYDLSCYYLYKDKFYTALFSPDYEIKAGHQSKNLEDYDYIVTDEVPKDDTVLENLAKYPKEKLLLFNFEPPIDQVRSQVRRYHAMYSKIFTWNDDFIDNVKYFKLGFPWMNPPARVGGPKFHEKKLCVLVGNNNSYPHIPCENYSERKKLIDYFECKQLGEFDFYGGGWPNTYKNYRGSIPANGDLRGTKIQVTKNYKFDICYENSKNLNGYISERIFDAFLAGCVPVYMGAPNILDYVPAECFIARKDFKSDDELYKSIKNMNKETYNTYIDNINKFLDDNGGYRLSSKYQIQQIRKVLGIS